MSHAGQRPCPAGTTPAAPSADAEAGWAQRKLSQRGLGPGTAAAGSGPDDTSAAPPASSDDGAGAADEKRESDRRREERRTGMTSRARIAMRGQEHDVPVLNLSRRGAMVAAEIGAREGERIAIQFPECNPLHGVIRWAGDGRIGIEFAQQTALLIPANWRLVGGRRNGEAPTEAVQRPRPPRHKLLWECELYWGRGADRVRLRNISADGAMLDGSKNVPVGTEVVLALRSAGTVNGSVKWCRAGQIGLKFDRSFDIRKLMAPGVVAEPSSSARPGVLKPLYLQTELDPDSPWAARSEKLKPRDFD